MWSFFDFLDDDDYALTILDIGAALLEEPAYQALIESQHARIIGFEPDADACQQLNARFGPPHRFMPLFVGDGKPGVFHQTNWGPTGSLFKPNIPMLGMFQMLGEVVVPVAEHPVETTRLDDIPEIDDVDFIKIDVQGSELAIFENAGRSLADAVLIQTEISFVESYVGQPMFSDVDAFLRQSGFQFHDFVGVGARSFKPFTNPADPSPDPLLRAFRQKIWGDAYYVKDWMRLDALAPAKLRKMAALLHDIVASYDLAHLVLCAMDRQTGGDTASRYLKRLQAGGHCSIAIGAPLDVPFIGSNEAPHPAMPKRDNLPGVMGRDSVILKTADGISVSVPASLNCITTYVLLEQEQWFERELGFLGRWLTKGMNAIDIGANVGVYSLPIARIVGPVGQVFAFEPAAASRKNLESGRIANILRNLRISGCALADMEKDGWLHIAASAEGNFLCNNASGDAVTEHVRVSTLDAQEEELHLPSIDFVKIDAEGQEARIIAGGRNFFASQSPLVMYEVKNGNSENFNLRWLFEALGYRTYRLLGDATCLVPVASDEELDPFQLNLFAAKPDRAATLEAIGLLVAQADVFSLTAEEQAHAIKCMLELPYARHFDFSAEDVLACDFGNAIVAFAAYRFGGLSPARRYSALLAAFSSILACCQKYPSASGLASLTRISLSLGYQHRAHDDLKRLLASPEGEIDQPFFPASERFEELSPAGREADWFVAAAMEQMELSKSHSSGFAGSGRQHLELLCEGPFASAEMCRRMILKGARHGMQVHELLNFIKPEHRHGNPRYWTEAGLRDILAMS